MNQVFAAFAVCAAALMPVGGRHARKRNLNQRFRRSRILGSKTQVGSVGPTNAAKHMFKSGASAWREPRSIQLGSVTVGPVEPIRTLSVVNAPTDDVEATVAQIKRCADAGADMVRVSVGNMNEVMACKDVRRILHKDGYATPIVADVVGPPLIALSVTEFVDIVSVDVCMLAEHWCPLGMRRADAPQRKRTFEGVLVPLVTKLQEKGKCLSIVVNYATIADSFSFQYGDKSQCLVALAMEFGEICQTLGFNDTMFSLLGLNTQAPVLVEAYRQLAHEMYRHNYNFPLHIEVVSSGGADGLVQAALGSCALLADGLGDSMCVAVPGDPANGVASCLAMRSAAKRIQTRPASRTAQNTGRRTRKPSSFPLDVPLNSDGSVVAAMKLADLEDMSFSSLITQLGLDIFEDGTVVKAKNSVDAVVIDEPLSEASLEKVTMLIDAPIGIICRPGGCDPDWTTLLHTSSDVNAPLPERYGGYALLVTGEETASCLEIAIGLSNPRLILFRPKSSDNMLLLARNFFSAMASLEQPKVPPALLWFHPDSETGFKREDIGMRLAMDCGSLFVDALGEGLIVDVDDWTLQESRQATFSIFHACGMRMAAPELSSRAVLSMPNAGARSSHRIDLRRAWNLSEGTMVTNKTGKLSNPSITDRGCAASDKWDADTAVALEFARSQDAPRKETGPPDASNLMNALGAQLILESL